MKPGFSVSAALVVAAAFSCAVPAARGQVVPPGEEGKLAELVPPKPGARASFRRVYDKAHLAAHPHQTVTAMEFRLAYHRFGPDETYPEGQRNYYFDLLVKRRGKDRRLSGMGECTPTPSGGIACGIECDGGGVNITRRQDGSLLVDLTVFGSIRLTEGCGDAEDDAVDLEAGRDDRTFRLDPVPKTQCPAYETW